jgi:hypothetical protein
VDERGSRLARSLTSAFLSPGAHSCSSQPSSQNLFVTKVWRGGRESLGAPETGFGNKKKGYISEPSTCPPAPSTHICSFLPVLLEVQHNCSKTSGPGPPTSSPAMHLQGISPSPGQQWRRRKEQRPGVWGKLRFISRVRARIREGGS